MTEQFPDQRGKNDPSSVQSAQPPIVQDDGRSYAGVDWAALFFHLLENIHWVLLAAVLCALVSGFYVKMTESPIYQTTSKIYIAGSETTISLADLQLGSSLAKDYQEVFKIWHVHEMVDERLGLDYSYSKLAGMVSVSNPDGSHLLYINVKSSDPQEAKLLADTYAEVVQEFIAEKMELRKPQLLEVAQVPTRPISPDIRATVTKGFVLGAALVAGFIAFFFLLDDKIRTADDVEKASGLATFGLLEKQEEKGRSESAPAKAPAPAGRRIAEIRASLSLDYAGDEAINTICSAITFAGRNQKRIAVTSYGANNGKTFITMQIACSMARRGKKVLLIDGDLRKSVLLVRYAICGTDKGLAHYLSGQAEMDDVIYPTNLPGLSLLPVGETVKTPLPLLTSADFEQLMNSLGQSYDLILVDTPPIGAVVDAAEIAKRCDGSLLVLEHNRQSKRELRYMRRMMEQTRTPVIGCVINKVTVRKLYRKQYYYQYGNRYDQDGGRAETAAAQKGASSKGERRRQ